MDQELLGALMSSGWVQYQQLRVHVFPSFLHQTPKKSRSSGSCHKVNCCQSKVKTLTSSAPTHNCLHQVLRVCVRRT